MVSAVKPGYINPLTMMGQKKDGLYRPQAESEKKQSDQKNDVEQLEIRRQTMQNQLLLMKNTSNGSGFSGDTVKALEENLEEITQELQTAKAQIQIQTESVSSRDASNYDQYQKEREKTEAPGLYEMKYGEDGYQIVFQPYSE